MHGSAIGYNLGMATDKRERQRANREERRAAEAKVNRRSNMLRTIRRVAVWLVLIVIVLVIAATVF